MNKKEILERNITNNTESFNFDMQLFASAPSPKDLMIGAGKVFFRLWDSLGNPLVRRHMGNVETLNLTPTIEKVQKMSSMNAAKEVYAEAVKSMTYKLTLTLDEYNPYNLALALYGEAGVETQEAQLVTDELYTVNLGSPISVPYKNITDVVIQPLTGSPAKVGAAKSFAQVGNTPGTAIVTSGGLYSGTDSTSYFITITKANSTAGTITDATFTYRKGSSMESAPITVTGTAQTLAEGVTVTFASGTIGQDLVTGEIYEIKVTPANNKYVAGVDYILDKTQLRGGIITIPDNSNIPDGQKVRVSYKVSEAKYPKIMGGTAKKIEGDLLFLGDPSHGRPYNLEVWHVSIVPTGDIGLITEEWGTFTLEMTVLSDRENHPEEPFFKLINVA